MDLLPQSIPERLSAKEYYELGLRYRLAGWVGLAREALSRVLKLEPDTKLSLKADKVMKTQLPRLPVPPEAEQRNIEGYNLMSSDRQRAKAIFFELTKQYPDFEWPFSNLCQLYMSEGKLAEARGIAKYLLSVNPDLQRSLSLMIELTLNEKEYEETLYYLQRSLTHYPDDEMFRQLFLFIKVQTKGSPPDTIPPHLSAEALYDLGVDYEMLGKLELSRKALQMAIEAAPDSVMAKKSADYISTHLPLHPVPPEIEKRYQQASSLVTSNLEAAKEQFEELTMECPDFEFPAIMLSSLAVREGQMNKAERLLRRVLTLNPSLSTATTLLAGIYAQDGKISEGLALLDKSLSTIEWPDYGLDLDLLKAQLQLSTIS